MKCPQCVKECKERGGLCQPPTFESREAAKDMGIDDDKAYALHKQVEHVMELNIGIWKCPQGHPSVEANPVDAMRAAGMEPML